MMPLDDEAIEQLARALHETFCEELRAAGYRLGEQTDDAAKTHSALKPFDELPSDEQEQNRENARDIPRKLASIHCRIGRRTPGSNAVAALSLHDIEQLSRQEHDRWMQSKLDAGWKWAPVTDKPKRLHQDLASWEQLPEATREKDRVLVRRIPWLLQRIGLQIECGQS